ncbi:ImmA/IrrE family metallo-endopeptidase [Listeria booriae]|uniref:ImmA/IrrE family metallo-endopeptidase n=1 Tax=Listeria booriae TaxID=1552123 RepID=UPI001624C200|nr:ImmA/IrrE family metallo-endopeptidase [Listeria booriae]MBC2148136.1 ImmA/IrrE family metallo-endopeptidase [Listeria booriae]
MYEWIFDKQEALIKKHGTRDPFELASALGIIVLFEELKNIYGFYNTVCQIKFIHINASMEYEEQRFTCSHELGHAVLHPELNTPFLNAHTLFSESKIEAQANFFATHLHIPKEKVDGVTTKQALLNYYGVPAQMERFI